MESEKLVKEKNDYTKLTEFFNKFQSVKVLAIIGIITFVIYYFLVITTEEFNLFQDVADWGVDQGVSALGWGLIFTFFSITLLVYPYQKKFRSKNADKLYAILIGFPIGFALYILFFWQWFSHLPFFNFYHLDNPFIITFGDKILHFLVSFILVLLAVKWIPQRVTVFVVFLLVNSFELFEIIFIVNFSGLYEINYEVIPLLDLFLEEIRVIFQALIPIEQVRDQIIHELIDILPDIIANSLGVIVGYLFVRETIDKEEQLKKKKKGK
jgi:hypothetical protein